MKRLILAGILLPLILCIQELHAECVYVIAPSVSTSMEARSVMARKGWTSCKIKKAEGIFVVVRSMLSNPLHYSYQSVFELEKDADFQLNISGENFHL